MQTVFQTIFQTIAVVARRQTPAIVDTVLAVERVLAKFGVAVVLEDMTAAFVGDASSPGLERRVLPREQLGDSQLIVVVGGDGSMLGVARDIAPHGVPVVGVNRGGLGFLAAVAPDQLAQQLQGILSGEYKIEDHFLLSGQVMRDGHCIEQCTALNDVVIHAGNMARMMEFELSVNGQFVYDQRSDGVIVASPTGSTAYALSAGGPIMHPALDAVAVVPMFPHTLTSRPLVVPGDSTLSIKVTRLTDSTPQASFDSQINVELALGDVVTIRKYHAPLRLLYPIGHSFYESCRSKLDWASRLGGQATEE